MFLLGLVAAALLGLGWVLQQRVAVRANASGLMSWTLLRELIGSLVWWGGIAALTAGQSLSAWALQLGPVTLVEPLLAACLVFAFVISAVAGDERVRWREIVGAVVLAAALGIFLAVADPRAHHRFTPTRAAILVGALVVAAASAGLVVLAKTLARRRPAAIEAIEAIDARALEAALIATAAGAMYGLQDAATRGAIVAVQHRPLLSLVSTEWPYLLLAAATAGVLLSQSAFRAGRLDYALPPTAATQALVGIALGVGVLQDQLSVSGAGIATEVVSFVALIAGAVLIARSPAFS